MKKVELIKKLHKVIVSIIESDDPELEKIGLELLEIEKKIMSHKADRR